jgi:hypothetical protein
MQESQVFRLFISSTFSDFKLEREVLHKDVYPYLQKYCNQYNYEFQLIDLRWGVNSDTQNNQKTLEYCLEEVKKCFEYKDPNFLILASNRYGWQPIPRIIEKSEFQKIVSFIKANTQNSNSIETLLKWYKIDKNQLYTLDTTKLSFAYVLQPRTDKYKNFDLWVEEENIIRDLFQGTVNKLDLTDKEQSKYYVSATEAEVIEGIFNYKDITQHQQKLLDEKRKILPNSPESSIFCFLRNIQDVESDTSNEYTDITNNKTLQFKENLKKSIHSMSTLESNVVFEDVSNPSASYLQKFSIWIKEQLEDKISKKIKSDNEKNELFSEVSKHNLYLQQKSENFIGKQNELEKILNIIQNNEFIDIEPILLRGKTNSGKTAFLGKLIKSLRNNENNRIIYRQLGLSKNSTNNADIIKSIITDINRLIIGSNHDNLIEYLNTNNHSIQCSQDIDKLVIIIDGMDLFDEQQRLSYHSIFKLLQISKANLSSNKIKIILSITSRENTDLDNICKKYNDVISLNDFPEQKLLLQHLLKDCSRTLTEDQYQAIFSNQRKFMPLDIIMLSQICKNWDYLYNPLSINTFLESYTDKEFRYTKFLEFLEKNNSENLVKYILIFITILNDNLSEIDLIHLLEADKDFVKGITSNSFHDFDYMHGVIPVSMWSQIFNQLRKHITYNFRQHITLSKDLSNLAIQRYSKDLESIHFQQIQSIKLLLDKYASSNDIYYQNIFFEAYLKSSVSYISTFKNRHLTLENIKEICIHYIQKDIANFSIIESLKRVSENTAAFNIYKDLIKELLLSTKIIDDNNIETYRGLFNTFLFTNTSYEDRISVGKEISTLLHQINRSSCYLNLELDGYIFTKTNHSDKYKIEDVIFFDIAHQLANLSQNWVSQDSYQKIIFIENIYIKDISIFNKFLLFSFDDYCKILIKHLDLFPDEILCISKKLVNEIETAFEKDNIMWKNELKSSVGLLLSIIEYGIDTKHHNSIIANIEHILSYIK